MLIGFTYITYQDNNKKMINLELKELNRKVTQYEKCAKKATRIDIEKLSGAVLVDDVITMYQIPAYKVDELKELKTCLKKLYNQ